MSLQVKNRITLDFSIPRIQNIRCVQGDKNSRMVHITITNNGKPYPIDPSTISLKYKIEKPDGKHIWNTKGLEIDKTDGTVMLTLSDQSMASPGLAKAALQAVEYDTGKILATMPFHIIVENPVVSSEDIISEHESDVITDMIFHLKDKNDPHESAEQAIAEATRLDDVVTEHLTEQITRETDRATAVEETKAPLADPSLTGTPKAPTASAGTNTTQIATTAFVQTAVSDGIAASDAMIIKGTLGTGGTIPALPTTYRTGWTYRVVSNGTYAGQVCEIGDLVIAFVDRNGSGNVNADWGVAQTNINGAITGVKTDNVYLSVNQSGSTVTISHKDVIRTNTTSPETPAHGGTFTAVKTVSSDSKGHVTGVDTATVTLPTVTYGDTSGTACEGNDSRLSEYKGTDGAFDGEPGLVPRSYSTDQYRFLRGDGTWSSINVFEGSTLGMLNGKEGLVPAPTYNDGDNKFLCANGMWQPTDNYVHPTGNGNNHIPSGGSSGQILKYSSPGTAVWGNETTYSDMMAATSSAAGIHGLVPAPPKGAQSKFLRGDGTWAEAADADIYGDDCINLGYGNNVWGGLIVNGNYNEQDSLLTGCMVIGYNNHIYSTIVGTGLVGIGLQGCNNQFIIGHYNRYDMYGDDDCNSDEGTSVSNVFVIGNGYESSESNAFRVTGEGYVYSASANMLQGADYAEYFEWSDSNPDSEDRAGYFVTFSDKQQIRKADADDVYILGISSGNPAICGNADECWRGRYILDDFGRYISEEFTYQSEELNPETGDKITVTKTGTRWKQNPEYDPTVPYVQRKDRPEWDAVGMLGVLSVYDDGTCQDNGYCTVADGGIATACSFGDNINTYRVLERVTDNIVKVVFR